LIVGAEKEEESDVLKYTVSGALPEEGLAVIAFEYDVPFTLIVAVDALTLVRRSLTSPTTCG
jgi:hypothetical protein